MYYLSCAECSQSSTKLANLSQRDVISYPTLELIYVTSDGDLGHCSEWFYLFLAFP